MQLSRHFSLDQLIHSDTAIERGIDNTPSPECLENLCRLAQGLELVMACLGCPLAISSGFRCAQLNAAVGGSPRSQHCSGLAADFTCPGYGTPLETARALAESDIEFDQCILEFGRWVHISFSPQPRRHLLTIYDSEAGYLDGLWDGQGKKILA